MVETIRARHFEELKRKVRELACKQISADWWEMWWEWMAMMLSEAQIKELKRLAETPYLQVVK